MTKGLSSYSKNYQYSNNNDKHAIKTFSVCTNPDCRYVTIDLSTISNRCPKCQSKQLVGRRIDTKNNKGDNILNHYKISVDNRRI